MQQTHAKPAGVRVAFPFILDLRHARLDVMELFQASEVFDLHEARRSKEDRFLTVDVLEVTPEHTRIKCTPADPCGYDDLARGVQELLAEAGRGVYGEPPVVERLAWEIDQHGVESDKRGHFRRVL